MKKFLAIIISTVMALSVCACGGGAKPVETTTAAETTLSSEMQATFDAVNVAREQLNQDAVNNTVFDYNSKMYGLYTILADATPTIHDLMYYTREDRASQESLITTHDFKDVVDLYDFHYSKMLEVYEVAYDELSADQKDISIHLKNVKKYMDDMHQALSNGYIKENDDGLIEYNLNYDLPKELSDQLFQFQESCNKYH